MKQRKSIKKVTDKRVRENSVEKREEREDSPYVIRKARKNSYLG
jgi:hypothetical protein